MAQPNFEETRPAAGSPTQAGATPPLAGGDADLTTPYEPTQPAPPDSGRLAEGAAPPVVPGYAIESVLGRGGMGVVYKAQHLVLKRTVALKMIRAGSLASADEVARFLTEAEAAARLQHPNILQVYEVGAAGGLPFCALEYAEGGSLAAKLSAGPLSPRAAAPLVATLARAMHLAHTRNVIHRDLKPANVLLAADGTPKIADFGSARRLDRDSGSTLAGDVIGTPSYMAPEQASGQAHAAGPACDVYALGAILYECLTGRPPFRGATAQETLEQVRTHEPMALRILRPGLPRDLETICLKCLRKEPEQRYDSAAALAEDLRRWLAGEPIRARPVGAVERAVKWVRRRPMTAALIAVGVLAAVAITGLLIVREVNAELRGLNDQLQTAAGEANDQRRRAEEQEDRARRFQYAADMQLAQRLLLDNIRHTADVDRAVELLQRQRPRVGQTDVRGLEWYILWRLCHRERATLYGEPPHLMATGSPALESFFRVAFTADGHGVVVGGASESVRVWEPDGGTVRTVVARGERFVPDHIDRRGWFTPLPDGRSLLVTAGEGAVVRLYDLAGERAPRDVWESGDRKRAVVDMAVSADGKRAALSCQDNLVRLRDLETGQVFPDARGPGNRGTPTVAFNPVDPNLLAIGGIGTKVLLWDVAAGRSVATLSFAADYGTVLAFAPNGKTLATAKANGNEVGLWDTTARGAVTALRQTIRLPTPLNGRLLFSPDSDCLVAGVGSSYAAGPTECVLWDIKAGKERARLVGHEGGVHALAFSPDGRILATAGTRDGVVRIWDVATGAERAALVGHTVPVFDLVFRADGRALATAGGTFGVFDNPFKRAEVKVWDAADWEPPAAVSGGTPWALAPDGRTVAVSDSRFLPAGGRPATRAVELYDLATGNRRARLDGQHYLAYSPDGGTMATAPQAARTVGLWDVADGKARTTRDLAVGSAAQLLFAPDGRTFAGCDVIIREPGPMVRPRPPTDQPGATVTLLDATTAEVRGCWPGTWGPVQFSADGTVLAAYGAGQTLKVIDIKGGVVQSTIQLPAQPHAEPQPFALAPDGRTVAVVGGSPGLFAEQPVTLYDAATGCERAKLHGDLNQVVCLAFSADGRTLATGHGGAWLAVGWIKLWDATTGAERMTLEGHRTMVTDLLFTADGKRLISASSSAVKFWDLVVGQEVLTLPGGPDLQMTRDGRRLAVGPAAENGSRVRLWRAAPAEKSPAR